MQKFDVLIFIFYLFILFDLPVDLKKKNSHVYLIKEKQRLFHSTTIVLCSRQIIIYVIFSNTNL